MMTSLDLLAIPLRMGHRLSRCTGSDVLSDGLPRTGGVNFERVEDSAVVQGIPLRRLEGLALPCRVNGSRITRVSLSSVLIVVLILYVSRKHHSRQVSSAVAGS